MMMMRRLFTQPGEVEPVQPRVTPEPQRAAELERKFSELAYCPETSFHRDRRQQRLPQYTKRKTT